MDSSYSHEVGIYSGADEGHFSYLTALLNSLTFYNDISLPVCIIDFGLSEANKIFIEKKWPFAELVDWLPFKPELEPITCIPGAKRYPNFQYCLKTFRKLYIARLLKFRYFFWIDADCLLLRPISEILPELIPAKIVAGRNGRMPMAAQFIDENPIVREALATHLLDTLQVQEYPKICINSGVLFCQHSYYRDLYEQFRDSILYKYGPYLYGDQALLNIAVMLRKDGVNDFRSTINMSVSANTKIVELQEQICNGRKCLGIQIDGVSAELYHFLYYKPHLNQQPTHPVQSLYQFWLDLI